MKNNKHWGYLLHISVVKFFNPHYDPNDVISALKFGP
jgi:hypothetical protein